MIGAQPEPDFFRRQGWARQMVRERGLKPIEAAVLHNLVSYSNERCEAWSSIATIAGDLGYKVKANGMNSAIRAALVRLEEEQLIWTPSRRRGERGPFIRELLCPALPSATTDSGAVECPRHRPPGRTMAPKLPSTLTDTYRPPSRTRRTREETRQKRENYLPHLR